MPATPGFKILHLLHIRYFFKQIKLKDKHPNKGKTTKIKERTIKECQGYRKKYLLYIRLYTHTYKYLCEYIHINKEIDTERSQS